MNDEAKSEQIADERGEKNVLPPSESDVGTDLLSVSDDGSNEDDKISDDGSQPFWKRRAVWIAVIAIVVIVVAGLVGCIAWSVRAREEALSDCRQSGVEIRKFAKAPLGKDAIDAEDIEKADVADTKIWEGLQQDQKALTGLARKEVPICNATSHVAAQEQQRRANASLVKLKKARASVEKSAKAVVASRDAKILKDNRDGLTAKVGQAKQLLDSSAGKVADDATRTVLSQQIDAANGLLGSRKVKVADLQQTSKTLDDAVNRVNASVQAKAEADAQAAQAAAAAAQAQVAQQQARNGQGQAAGGGSQGNQQPERIHNGGYNSFKEWMAHQKPPGNGCNAAGFCAIG
ncbi:hypothetical protein [Bifidobacterium sp. ESL0732]|uniref:hypothetical protein n=1 Tax=Bifidobacterium sp. ESL0732 TaxID=2983222 RepID=UPI0023F9D420|nr:hypothetical protein [Bifidobacterium sp. ESL0732]WEV64269.1 hypothetical protein OZX70_01340 [Bifidobacterium sp. ESL0732]